MRNNSFGQLLLGVTVVSAGVIACKVRRTIHLADVAGTPAQISAELIELIVDVASPSVIGNGASCGLFSQYSVGDRGINFAAHLTEEFKVKTWMPPNPPRTDEQKTAVKEAMDKITACCVSGNKCNWKPMPRPKTNQ